jgi:hypothetical protein
MCVSSELLGDAVGAPDWGVLVGGCWICRGLQAVEATYSVTKQLVQ